MPYNSPMAKSLRRPGRGAVRNAALGLLGLIGLAGVVLLIWWVPPALYGHVQDEPARVSAEASTRTGLIAGLAGLAALGGLAITARTYRLTEQGHITDRYTKAIEQLGSAKLDVRLGGNYALERIAHDSRRDHPTVVEVLSAFIREHSNPAVTNAEPTVAEVLNTFLRDAGQPTATPRLGNETEEDPRLATDVQAALTVLGRMPHRPEIIWGADLTDAQLAGAELAGADLSAAALDGANLSSSWVVEANLSTAALTEANLSDARLDKANLSGALLSGSDLSGAWLAKANLTGAWLVRAKLTGAVLGGANLTGAHLEEVDLTAVVGLTQVQLDSAHGDRTTLLPDNLQRPTSWPAKSGHGWPIRWRAKVPPPHEIA